MSGAKFRLSIGWRPVLLAGIASAALLLLTAACGDDDSSSATKTAAPAASSASAAASSAGGGGNDSGDASQQLKSLAEDWSKITAKITYKFSNTIQSNTTAFTMTMYSRPPDSRIDFDYGDQGTAVTIDAGGKTYTCLPSANVCYSGPSLGAVTSSLPIFGEVADPNSIDSAIGNLAGLEHTTDNIAGEDADCFKASGTAVAEQGDISWCFSKDGLLLRSSFSAAGTQFLTEATGVSRDVSDSDFEPPYPVTNLPGSS